MIEASQSCCHQSYPKSAKSLFGHPDYITDQKLESECVNLYCEWIDHQISGKIWLLKTLRSQYWYIDGAKCNAINHIGSPAAAEEKGYRFTDY